MIFAFASFNRLHLLWVVPSSLILGWVVAFGILPLPVIGTALRDILLLFAHVFFLGTDWELGGYPWEIAVARTVASRASMQHDKSPEEFESAIKERQELLFGYYLYYKGIKFLHSAGFHDNTTMDSTNFHYSQIKERNTKSVLEAKELLAMVKRGEKDVTHLSEFVFPPIHGPGLDEMTGRAKALVRAYERVFPGRPSDRELTEEEYFALNDAAMSEWPVDDKA
ncbi:MAG: hypothetical protein Q7J67_09630 [bacterium]|nr:hypothetical protein [bacterium]